MTGGGNFRKPRVILAELEEAEKTACCAHILLIIIILYDKACPAQGVCPRPQLTGRIASCCPSFSRQRSQLPIRAEKVHAVLLRRGTWPGCSGRVLRPDVLFVCGFVRRLVCKEGRFRWFGKKLEGSHGCGYSFGFCHDWSTPEPLYLAGFSAMPA